MRFVWSLPRTAHPSRGAAALVALATLCACASHHGSTTDARRSDRNVITGEQIREHHFTNAYEAVESLHSNWLLTRGADSFASPGKVRVYMDNVLMGGVETLRAIETPAIVYIQHYDGVAATARWGIDHGQGVIFVSTRVAGSDP